MPVSNLQSGSYEYLLDGERTGVREQWQRREQADGGWLVSSSRTAPGLEIAVEARVDDGLVSAVELAWRGEGQLQISAGYRLRADHIQFTRSVGARVTEQREMPIAAASPAPLLSPLMRIFTGIVIARLLERGGAGTVIVPDIRDPRARDELLLPLAGERQALIVDAEASLPVDGVEVACRLCEYRGEQYGPGTLFWLGADDVLLRYQWQQARQHWDVCLQRDSGA